LSGDHPTPTERFGTTAWQVLGVLPLAVSVGMPMAKRVKSNMPVANVWHARSDAVSSLVVGIGIIGDLANYPIRDPIAALIASFMVAKMGWEFGWPALHDLMDRSVDEQEVRAIRRTLNDVTHDAVQIRSTSRNDIRQLVGVAEQQRRLPCSVGACEVLAVPGESRSASCRISWMQRLLRYCEPHNAQRSGDSYNDIAMSVERLEVEEIAQDGYVKDEHQ